MRFATKEESDSIYNYIKSISNKSGKNLFDENKIEENYNCEKCKYPLMNPLCGIFGNNIKPCGRKSNEL